MSKRNRLELTWIGKDERPRLEPHILLEEPELSYRAKKRVGENDIFDNMLIQGDNLLALKALEQEYAGKVKCVFIDPPYNTGSAFAQYDDGLEHSIWLSLMRDRLEILKALLSDDGSLWITIDDNEVHYLKVLCDEVFGRDNFVANVVWQKKYTVANDAKWLSVNHDHVLVYAVDKRRWRPNRLQRSAEMDARYRNPDNHPKGPWKATPLHAKSGSKKSKTFTYRFRNGVVWSPPPGTFPRFSAEALKQMDENDEIWFGADGKATPSRKTFLSELRVAGPPAPTVWLHTDVGNNHEARDEVKAFNGADPFATPKPEKLLKRILDLATDPGDLVLDSFAGSGTTGAVAHKMGRRWIMVELGEHAKTHIVPRLKKVIDGEDLGGITESVDWKGGGGFRFYRLAPSLLEKDKWGTGSSIGSTTPRCWPRRPASSDVTLEKRAETLSSIYDSMGYHLVANRIRAWVQRRDREDPEIGDGVLVRLKGEGLCQILHFDIPLGGSGERVVVYRSLWDGAVNAREKDIFMAMVESVLKDSPENE